MENIFLTFKYLREGEESFLETVRRTGIEPFQERVYENH
jgi:sulfite reductase (NADPH) hemoprotein beta-component